MPVGIPYEKKLYEILINELDAVNINRYNNF